MSLAASGPVAVVGTGGRVPTVMVAVHRVAVVGTGGRVPTVMVAVHRVATVPAVLFPGVVMVGRALAGGAKAVSSVLDPMVPARTPVIDRLGRSIVIGPVAGADRIDLPARSTVIVPIQAAAQASAASGPEAVDRIVPEQTDRAVTEVSPASGPAVLARGDHRVDRDAPIGSTIPSVDATGR